MLGTGMEVGLGAVVGVGAEVGAGVAVGSGAFQSCPPVPIFTVLLLASLPPREKALA